MIEDREREMSARLRQAAAECKRGAITPDELRRRRYEEIGRLEQRAWQIIEDIRTKARESQGEGFRKVAGNVADLLERELRKGHGRA